MGTNRTVVQSRPIIPPLYRMYYTYIHVYSRFLYARRLRLITRVFCAFIPQDCDVRLLVTAVGGASDRKCTNNPRNLPAHGNKTAFPSLKINKIESFRNLPKQNEAFADSCQSWFARRSSPRKNATKLMSMELDTANVLFSNTTFCG